MLLLLLFHAVGIIIIIKIAFRPEPASAPNLGQRAFIQLSQVHLQSLVVYNCLNAADEAFKHLPRTGLPREHGKTTM